MKEIEELKDFNFNNWYGVMTITGALIILYLKESIVFGWFLFLFGLGIWSAQSSFYRNGHDKGGRENEYSLILKFSAICVLATHYWENILDFVKLVSKIVQ